VGLFTRTIRKELVMYKNTNLLFSGFICLFLICFLGAVNSYALDIGGDFPSFYLKDINGNDFFLNEYAGEKATKNLKVIIFSFCASYCQPCKREIPELEKVMEKYKDKGLGVFLVALEKEELARSIIEETKTTIPVLLDRHLVLQKLIGFTGIPFTVIIDSDKKVRYVGTAFPEGKEAEVIERLENAVMDVLGSDSDSPAR
ncbi:TlpA family protein disulfide reductase, partial [Candidatus Latescibacterota bacterium]